MFLKNNCYICFEPNRIDMMTYLEKLDKLQRFEKAMTIFKLIVTSTNFNAIDRGYTGKIALNIDTLEDSLKESFKIFLEHKVEFESMLRSYNFNIQSITETSVTVTDNILVPEHVPFF